MHKRIRSWMVAFFLASTLSLNGVVVAAETRSPLSIGLTAVFLDDQTSLLREWQHYLEARLGRPVRFVQRQTYREITEMLLDNQIDVAWICGFPYVRYPEQLRLLAVPLFEGKPLYRAYLIVPAADTKTQSLFDLKDSVFAFSDPDSNSGYLVPQVTLVRAGFEPRWFFKRTFFTWAHRDVVRAVAEGVANGGSVDGYVWETLRRDQPELVARTRVVNKSEYFGFPPLVARASLDGELFEAVRHELIGMAANPAGKRLLERLNLDGFVAGKPGLFDAIREAFVEVENGRPG
ncbi:MAG: phosphate/phosphite/phosphonate ABC transporter substrate-binding protein [Gammaproteobacteria bacterium]